MSYTVHVIFTRKKNKKTVRDKIKKNATSYQDCNFLATTHMKKKLTIYLEKILVLYKEENIFFWMRNKLKPTTKKRWKKP